MKRRNLLRGALAAGLTAPAIAALTAARTDVDQTLSPDTPQDLADLEAAVAGPKQLIKRFDSSCFNGEYVTGIDAGYFERIRKLRSDDAKKSRRAS